LVIFPLLITADAIWLFTWGCAEWYSIFLALGIGIGTGIGWSAVIKSAGLGALQYLTIMSNAQVCSLPSKTMFKCTNKKMKPKQKSSATQYEDR
jgi:hypothetical protein